MIKRRIGFILIDISYLMMILDIFMFCNIQESYVFIPGIFLIFIVLMILFGIYLIGIRNHNIIDSKETKLDSALKIIALIPVVTLLAIPFIIIEIIIFLFCKEKSFIQKTKPLRKLGYKMKVETEDRKKIYYFTYDNLVLRIIPNTTYEISFDKGKNFMDVVDSNVGTYQEIQHLKLIQHQYKTADYRDKDLYDSTTEFVKFIVKNISLI